MSTVLQFKRIPRDTRKVKQKKRESQSKGSYYDLSCLEIPKGLQFVTLKFLVCICATPANLASIGLPHGYITHNIPAEAESRFLSSYTLLSQWLEAKR